MSLKDRRGHNDNADDHIDRNHFLPLNSCQPVCKERLLLRGNGEKESTPLPSLPVGRGIIYLIVGTPEVQQSLVLTSLSGRTAMLKADRAT